MPTAQELADACKTLEVDLKNAGVPTPGSGTMTSKLEAANERHNKLKAGYQSLPDGPQKTNLINGVDDALLTITELHRGNIPPKTVCDAERILGSHEFGGRVVNFGNFEITSGQIASITFGIAGAALTTSALAAYDAPLSLDVIAIPVVGGAIGLMFREEIVNKLAPTNPVNHKRDYAPLAGAAASGAALTALFHFFPTNTATDILIGLAAAGIVADMGAEKLKKHAGTASNKLWKSITGSSAISLGGGALAAGLLAFPGHSLDSAREWAAHLFDYAGLGPINPRFALCIVGGTLGAIGTPVLKTLIEGTVTGIKLGKAAVGGLIGLTVFGGGCLLASHLIENPKYAGAAHTLGTATLFPAEALGNTFQAAGVESKETAETKSAKFGAQCKIAFVQFDADHNPADTYSYSTKAMVAASATDSSIGREKTVGDVTWEKVLVEEGEPVRTYTGWVNKADFDATRNKPGCG